MRSPLLVNLAIAVAATFGLLMHIRVFLERPPTAICGTDFPIFYGSSKLLGTPGLYSPDAVQGMQEQLIGCKSAAAAFIRLPYFAALVRPFTLLPLGTAFALWRLLLIAAELGFVAFFGRRWKWALLACVWSWPLAWDLDNGQDASFMLLALMAGLWLWSRGRPFAAGLCFSWCAAKPHLVVLLPLLLLGKWGQPDLRRLNRKVYADQAVPTFFGLATGGAVALVLSFAVAGWSWPAQFLRAISNPRIDPTPMELHNIRGLVQGSAPLEIVLGLTVAAAVWVVCRRAPIDIALAAVLAGSLLVCHHLTASDWCMLLPVGLIVAFGPFSWAVRAAAIVLISPLVVLFQNQPALKHLPDLLLLSLVYALAWETWRMPQFSSGKRTA